MIRDLAVTEAGEWLRTGRSLWPDCDAAMPELEAASDTELFNEAAIAGHGTRGFRETFRLVHLLRTVGRERER